MKPRSLLTAEDKTGYFHTVSRVVDKRFVFQEAEREHFAELLRRVEAFSGVQVLTWTILSNHFHILLHVPPAEKLSDEEWWGRLKCLYTPQELKELEQTWERYQEMGYSDGTQKIREQYEKRMWDLSEFMKTLKQRFSQWFNKREQRDGTLWECRFRCARIEGSRYALSVVSAYVDLNAVRAGMVETPEEYRWCGYAEAVAGNKRARRGYAEMLQETKPGRRRWSFIGPRYRLFLFGNAEERESKRGISKARIKEVLESGGQLSLPELLRCKVRYFTDGLVIGSREYLKQYAEANQERHGERKTYAHRLKGRAWDGLCSFRALQKACISVG
jgi:REP element-mobilizing transposase RayT